MRVAVLGAGYVGLVTGACLAQLGHDVSVLDIDRGRVDALRGGHSPIVEPGLEDLLASNAQRLTFDLPPIGLHDADVVIVAVGTPSTPSGAADLHSCATLST